MKKEIITINQKIAVLQLACGQRELKDERRSLTLIYEEMMSLIDNNEEKEKQND